MDRTARPARVVRTALLAAPALAIASLAGCGDDDADEPGTQPAPGVSTFEDASFSDLPQHPRSEPFGTQSEQDGIVTQSFRTNGATSEQVLDFYADALEEQGWMAASPVNRADTSARRDWVRGDHRLEVSATEVDGNQVPDERDAVVQYSLVLRPRDE